MKFREYIKNQTIVPNIHDMIHNCNLKYTQSKCKDPEFRLYKEGDDPFISPTFIGKYNETIKYLEGITK